MAIELCANTVGGHLFRATVTFAVTGSYDLFHVISIAKTCLEFYVESYQSDYCRFTAVTLSPLHLVVN